MPNPKSKQVQRNKVKALLKPLVESILKEASEIEESELNDSQRKLVAQLSKILEDTPTSYHEGIHGYVVTFKDGGEYSTGRLDKDMLVQLSKLNIRWIEHSFKSFSVGF